MATYHWHRYSAAESFERVKRGENPWVAPGDFLLGKLRICAAF